ncbi:MAG: hypothetical protein M3N42_18400 [Cyanobacteriota bacterium]|nr:hypothetical protein [Cyanobacteriota bacterium]
MKKARLKTDALQLLGKLPPTVKVLKAAVYQKQAIVDSLEQAVTVWDWGDQPISCSGKDYSRLFEEITAALT